MRIAVVSDIHSNLVAFQEVLADIDRSRVDRIVSLGDNIGYGPEPEEVLRMVRARGIDSIMGNHELGIADPSCLSWFNRSARKSLEINRLLLSSLSIEHIRGLLPTLASEQCLFVHGFPPDSATTYLFEVSDFRLGKVLSGMEEELCFVGHTHDLHLIAFDGRSIRHAPVSEGHTHLREGFKYLINAGSVGQPRDGDNRSKYVIWDSDERRIEARFIPYDIARTARAILALGLPRLNADRLW